MIKNKILDIEIIFKTYLKILKIFYVSKSIFVLLKIKNLFSKTVVKNYILNRFQKYSTSMLYFFCFKKANIL